MGSRLDPERKSRSALFLVYECRTMLMTLRTLAVLALLLVGCNTPTKEDPRHQAAPADLFANPALPDWAKNANIYEVNIRQYTPEGTLTAFARHLPRLEEMGVDILWFMPIYPISETKRKGPMGSYYAISDYTAVNPQMGTLAEFRDLVVDIHDRGMRVLLDWVPNHTGWDHHWISEHPDFYTRDADGNIIDPINPETGESWGWTDVADLNYDNPAMREAMRADMRFWLEEVGIDGYRVDVAHNVPTDFWAETIPELRADYPELFLLAEAEYPPLNNRELFAMSYSWSFHHLLNRIAQGEATAADLDHWRETERTKWDKGLLMHFITNHDENSWNGTVRERLGSAADAMAVLICTYDGMPLLYSGQEAGLDQSLKFFEKDEIPWGNIPKQGFYSRLLHLKKDHPALWNGPAGGPVVRLATGVDEAVYAFGRKRDGRSVLVLLNLTDQPQTARVDLTDWSGTYTELFSAQEQALAGSWSVDLAPWAYQVWHK